MEDQLKLEKNMPAMSQIKLCMYVIKRQKAEGYKKIPDA
jgi:hypothetical protein